MDRDPSMNKVGVVEASEASAGTDQPLDNIPQSINHFFTLKKVLLLSRGNLGTDQKASKVMHLTS
jgi:hypothetical protein